MSGDRRTCSPSNRVCSSSSLTQAAQVIAHVLPAMYYTNIVLGSFLKGVGFQALWLELLILAFYATVLFTIGYRMFSKRPKV
jgi:ABC-2 type transport system permease protein/ribosome-dependent ATPase